MFRDSVSESPVLVPAGNRRTSARSAARACSSKFGDVCRALWPIKTAVHLAASAEISQRAASYYIGGHRSPCAAALRAVINEMLSGD